MIKIRDYFGLTKVHYLQVLANRFGDFRVAIYASGRWYHSTVISLWQSNINYLKYVNHRQVLPIELMLDIEYDLDLSKFKHLILDLPYAVYKSLHGYHISLLNPSFVPFSRQFKELLLTLFNSDFNMLSAKHLISLEFTPHWKDSSHKISLIEHTPEYPYILLGDEY